ncbi:MAG: RNA polymerase sigma factor [Planctomycetota bacterium]|jgi:RNA polymerase sigma factor (sigma-70 family)
MRTLASTSARSALSSSTELDSSPGRSRTHLAEHADAEATRLMARFRDSGELEDFERLYAETWQPVLHWIRSLLRQSSARLDAYELLQDTFVNVFRYPRGFRDESPSSFRVWVRTIAGNVLRRAKARMPRETSYEFVDGTAEPASTAVGPAVQAHISEAAEHLRRSMSLLLAFHIEAYLALSPRDQRALELVEVEGHAYIDAAAILGVRASNMKMIVFRARRRLYRRMASRLGVAAAAAA